MLETIREYLIGLGFEVNKNSFNTAKKAMNEMESNAGKLVSTFVKGFGQAAVAMAAFGVAAATSTAKFLNGLGNQEIQMEILSRQLWTTQQQAMAFNATLKAMGTNLQSLYLSPTLMSQYQQLNGVAQQMTTPGDYNQQIKLVQNLQLQFKQLKLEAYYALQWIGYYFLKFMNGPISKLQGLLQSINSVIVKNMPNWTKRAAEWMASFWQAGVFIAQAMGDVYNWLKKLGSYIPGWAKAIVAALAVISISNPFMLFVEALAVVLLMLDDFYTYLKDPSKSAMPQFWGWVMKLYDGMKKFGEFKNIGQDIQSAFQKLGNTLRHVQQFVTKLFQTFQDNGTFKSYINAWKSYGKALWDVVSAIGSVISGIGHLWNKLSDAKGQSDMTGFFQMIMTLGTDSINIMSTVLTKIASMIRLVGDVLHGNWIQAWTDIKNMASSQDLANNGIIPQSQVGLSTGAGGAYGGDTGSSAYIWPWFRTSATGSSDNSTKTTNVNAPQTINNNYYGTIDPNSTTKAQQQVFNKLLYNVRSGSY